MRDCYCTGLCAEGCLSAIEKVIESKFTESSWIDGLYYRSQESPLHGPSPPYGSRAREELCFGMPRFCQVMVTRQVRNNKALDIVKMVHHIQQKFQRAAQSPSAQAITTCPKIAIFGSWQLCPGKLMKLFGVFGMIQQSPQEAFLSRSHFWWNNGTSDTVGILTYRYRSTGKQISTVGAQINSTIDRRNASSFSGSEDSTQLEKVLRFALLGYGVVGLCWKI